MTESLEGTRVESGSAATRALLTAGIIAGPFYLVFGLALALTRPGFELTRDALSLLLIGDLGWLQWLNLVLSGLMTIAAAIGLLRAPTWSRTAATLVGVLGVCVVLSALFPPDATEAFPPGAGGGEFTTSGVLHLVFGGLGFISAGAAAIIAGSWFRRHTLLGPAWSRIAGVVIIVAFVAGGALGALPAGVALLWLTVLTTWTWLALACLATRRAGSGESGSGRA